MIIITGAAGFIGSCVTAHLQNLGYKDLVLVDDFSIPAKQPNFIHREKTVLVNRDEFIPWLSGKSNQVEIIIHLGARTNTAEFDEHLLERLNTAYSKAIWTWCTENQIPLIYASSAATYGDGHLGYSDDPGKIPSLIPLNPYGWSKQRFDMWVLAQKETPFFWAGLKFFNVYGPNEYHKGRMASVIFHAYNQIKETGKVKLFKSHREEYKNGEQLRDFVYVKDVVSVIQYLMENRPVSGIFNLGTGKARTFLDLTHAVFQSMGTHPDVEFMDIPEDIRNTYQYYTQAEMDKLIHSGYTIPFTPLEEGIADYVQSYLTSHKIW